MEEKFKLQWLQIYQIKVSLIVHLIRFKGKDSHWVANLLALMIYLMKTIKPQYHIIHHNNYSEFNNLIHNPRKTHIYAKNIIGIIQMKKALKMVAASKIIVLQLYTIMV